MVQPANPDAQVARLVSLIIQGFPNWTHSRRASLIALVNYRAPDPASDSSSVSSVAVNNLAANANANADDGADDETDEDDATYVDAGEDDATEDDSSVSSTESSVVSVDSEDSAVVVNPPSPSRAIHLKARLPFLKQLRAATVFVNAQIVADRWELSKSLQHVLSYACCVLHGIYPAQMAREYPSARDFGDHQQWLLEHGRVDSLRCQRSFKHIFNGTTVLRGQDNQSLANLPDGTPIKFALKLLRLRFSLSDKEGTGTIDKWVLWAPCTIHNDTGFIFPSKDGGAYRTSDALARNAADPNRVGDRNSNLTAYVFPQAEHSFPRTVQLEEAHYLFPVAAKKAPVAPARAPDFKSPDADRKQPPSSDRKPPPSSGKSSRKPSSGKSSRKPSSGQSSGQKRKSRP